MDTLFALSSIPIGWVVGLTLGWWTARIDYGPLQRPWNWRVLVGPWAYFPWLDRTASTKEN